MLLCSTVINYIEWVVICTLVLNIIFIKCNVLNTNVRIEYLLKKATYIDIILLISLLIIFYLIF